MRLPDPRDDGLDSHELLNLAERFVALMRASGVYPEETMVVVNYEYVKKLARPGYHNTTEELAQLWRLRTPDHGSTLYAITEHHQLVRIGMLTSRDLEGRAMMRQAQLISDRQYFMSANLVVPWNMTPREVADLLRANVAQPL